MSQLSACDLTCSWTGLIFYVHLFGESLHMPCQIFLKFRHRRCDFDQHRPKARLQRTSIQFKWLSPSNGARRMDSCFRRNGWSSSLTANYRLQNAIHSVVTTRIILNIREAASQRLDGVSSNLHLSDIGFRVPSSRVSFVGGPLMMIVGVTPLNLRKFDDVSVARIWMVSIRYGLTQPIRTWGTNRERVVVELAHAEDGDGDEGSIRASPGE